MAMFCSVEQNVQWVILDFCPIEGVNYGSVIDMEHTTYANDRWPSLERPRTSLQLPQGPPTGGTRSSSSWAAAPDT